MAELVGLAASVTGLLGVGVAAVETSRSLRKLSRDIKFADKDIRMLDVAIRAFRNEIGFVHDRLIPQLSKPNRLSIFDYLERRKVFDDLLTQSKLAQEYIERLRPKINSLKSSIGMMTKLKWAFFKKQDIRDIGPQMETLKSSLTLIMMTVVMEGLLEGVQTEETQNEIIALKSHVRRQMKMIKKLQSLVQSESRPTVSSGIRQPPLTDCIEVLLELGKSLVKDETVPSPETRRKRQAIYIMDNNQNRSLEQEHPLRQMQDSAVSLNLRSPTRSRRNRSRSRRTEVRTSQPSTPMPTNAQDIRPVLLSVSFAAQNTAELVQNGVVTSRTTDVTSSSSGSYRSNEYIIEPSPQAPLHNESEFINVRPLQGHIPFPQPNSTPSLKGYIRTPSGCELIEARVNRQTMSSVISQAYAEKCGLEVNQLEDDVDMWIYFSPRRAKKCKATVTIRWSPEQIGQRLFPVQCFVCKDYPMDIVFGKSFLDKREDYRRMWSAEDEV